MMYRAHYFAGTWIVLTSLIISLVAVVFIAVAEPRQADAQASCAPGSACDICIAGGGSWNGATGTCDGGTAPNPGPSAVDSSSLSELCQSQSSTAVCQDYNAASSGDPITGSDGVVATIFIWVVRLTGLASVIMVVIGGFKYVISAGDSSGVQSAKNTILYAVIGLAVTGFAGGIVRFVVGRI